MRINPFSHKSKTMSSERKNYFCELRDFYYKFAVSITRFSCDTSKCTLKQGDVNPASERGAEREMVNPEWSYY